MNKQIKTILLIAAALSVLSAVSVSLLYSGVIHINNPEFSGYKVKGVDVSSFQGDIDWKVLSSQDIDFAYIKATEGSSTVDRCFKENWNNASETSLRIGAYHFFSFESSGKTQAELFCNTVEPVDNMLPPVIDVEFYGRFHSASDINVSAVKNELRAMIDQLTEHYGIKPVIYVSRESYDGIIGDDFSDCDLWYRSVYSGIPGNIDWTFWQYSNRHRLQGYDGTEKYIDMNVFRGSADELRKYGKISG